MDRKLNTSGFTQLPLTRSLQPAHRCSSDSHRNASVRRNRNAGHGGTTDSGNRFFLLTLLSLCTLAFTLLFVFEIIQTDYAENALAAMKSVFDERDNTQEDDEELGKLHLVQLPSILEVFAPSDSPIAPLMMNQCAVDEKNSIAKIYAPAGTQVVSMLKGTVKAVSSDEKLGGYVIVSHDNDIEICYYGLADIAVERGQPILQNSTIGYLERDVLYLKITKSGRPVDPFEFLGISAEPING